MYMIYRSSYLYLESGSDLIGHIMALIPIGSWLRDSTYRVHPLGLMDSIYRVPLLDSKLVRLCYAWYYRIKSPSGPSSTLTVLRMPHPSFWTLNAAEPHLTYPNLYI